MPLSALIIAGAAGAVGGAAGKLTERVCDVGTKWLGTYFKDHQPKAIEKAEANAQAFVSALAEKVSRLEESMTVEKSVLDRALEEPSVGALLQAALIGSAQTASAEKHELFASLLVNRLTAENESMFAVSSRLACDAVINCTTRQIHILAFHVGLFLNWSEVATATFESRETFILACRAWFETRFKAFFDFDFRDDDLWHLESVSCLTLMPVFSISLDSQLAVNWKSGEWKLKQEDLADFPAGQTIIRLWDKGLNKARTTSVGKLIGVMASDLLCEAPPTNFPGWSDS